jgi:hypothetical protein
MIDRKAYGWISELETRADGFYGRVKWSDAGLDLVRNAHFKFYSPYWEAREIGSEKGRRVYRPVALISVGLTNQPNIPVRPLANETSEGNECGEAAESVARGSMSEGEESLLTSTSTRAGQIENHTFANRAQMHTVSCTEGLRWRKPEMARLHNRRDRIQECVLVKMRLGLSYDEAWEHVKREHAGWFEQG